MRNLTGRKLAENLVEGRVYVFGFAERIPVEKFKAEDFTAGPYVGRVLMKHPSGYPAVLMESMIPTTYPWRVEFPGCNKYFRTRKEALQFCRNEKLLLAHSGEPA